jgi:hypothetical protein
MMSPIWLRTRLGLLLALSAAGTASAPAPAANCEGTSTGLSPIDELGADLYLGQFQGGLYPGGLNSMPASHFAAGRARADAVRPLDAQGQPAENSKIVLLSIGMSNTTQEFCSAAGTLPCDPWTFMGQAAVHPAVDQTALVIVNGARGGQTASTWDDPADANYDRIRDLLLAQGLSEAQVQAVWVKVANPQPTASLPDPAADAYALLESMGAIARTLRVRYPNVRTLFLSSRIYAGYASTALNPEPYAYESGFAVKWLIEAQIRQMESGIIDPLAGDLNYNTAAPWVSWGPYLWGDGLTARLNGLIWECDDLQSDGTHPAQSGEEKVGTMLLDFFLNSSFTSTWFRTRTPALPGDTDLDGDVDLADLSALLSAFGSCVGGPRYDPSADINNSGCVSLADLSLLLGNFGG